MNPNYSEFKFPQIKAHPWHKVSGSLVSMVSHFSCSQLTSLLKFVFMQLFGKRMPPEAVDLVSRLLQYSPNLRCTAVRTNLRSQLYHLV